MHKSRETIDQQQQAQMCSADDTCPICRKVKNEDGWCDCWQGQNRYIDEYINQKGWGAICPHPLARASEKLNETT